jgi:hypothetical protein
MAVRRVGMAMVRYERRDSREPVGKPASNGPRTWSVRRVCHKGRIRMGNRGSAGSKEKHRALPKLAQGAREKPSRIRWRMSKRDAMLLLSRP